jgi:hypothetical protein
MANAFHSSTMFAGLTTTAAAPRGPPGDPEANALMARAVATTAVTGRLNVLNRLPPVDETAAGNGPYQRDAGGGRRVGGKFGAARRRQRSISLIHH